MRLTPETARWKRRVPRDFLGYSLRNASDIKTIVTQGAGGGKIGF
jgi:pectate lyase